MWVDAEMALFYQVLEECCPTGRVNMQTLCWGSSLSPNNSVCGRETFSCPLRILLPLTSQMGGGVYEALWPRRILILFVRTSCPFGRQKLCSMPHVQLWWNVLSRENEVFPAPPCEVCILQRLGRGEKKGPLTSMGAYISLFFCFPKMVPISWQASGEFVKRGGTEPGGHSVHPFLQKQVVCTQIPTTRQLWVPGSHSVSIVSSTIGVYGQSLHGSGCCQHKKLRAIPWAIYRGKWRFGEVKKIYP